MTPPPLKHRPALPPTLITMFAEVRNCAVAAAIRALSPRVVSTKAAVCTPLTVNRAPGCVRQETPGGGSGAMTAISEWPRTSSLVAVIDAVPPVRAVTIPAGVTVATCTSSLVHVTGRPASAWPRESFGVALSGRVWPESTSMPRYLGGGRPMGMARRRARSPQRCHIHRRLSELRHISRWCFAGIPDARRRERSA